MEKNRLQQELDTLHARGAQIIDLVDTNFHKNGYRLPDELLLPLMEEYVRTRIYAPDPKGSITARESISAYYAAQGVAISPDDILLTASSSESYNLLFNNLASPGDNLVLPSPTYPLFEFLAEFNRLEVRFYRMDRDYRIDLASLAAVIDARTRFVVVISPNNPTGQVASREELEGMAELCERYGAAIISDEVFSEFLYAPYAPAGETPPSVSPSEPFGLPRPAALGLPLPVYTLNGISKMFASPDLKLGWIAVSGDRKRIAEPVERLEVANDIFLNCSSLAQFILPALFAKAGKFTKGMVADLARKRDVLVAAVNAGAGVVASRPPAFDATAGGAPDRGSVSLLPPRGGIHCPVRIALPGGDDEEFALGLLRERLVYLHPGYFYGFEEAADSFHVVLSFLLREDLLAEGLSRFIDFLSRP